MTDDHKPIHPAWRWLRAIGFYRGFLLVSFIPVSLAFSIAWWETGVFSPGIYLWTQLAVWAVHVGSNLINDYYDHVSGTDDINEVHTPFSGGTRVIQEGLLDPQPIRRVGYLSLAAGGSALVALAAVRGWPIALLTVLGVGCGIAYSARPVWLAYRGLGEFTLGLAFGPLLVMTGYYAQTRTLSSTAVVVGCVMGLLSAAIITINEVPDILADRAARKMNLVARYGRSFGLVLWASLLWGAMTLLLAGAVGGLLPLPTMIVLIMVVPIFAITRRAEMATKQLEGVVGRCRATILTQVGTWFLLLAGFVLAGSRVS